MTSSEEEEINDSVKSTSVTSVFASLDFKSAKKSVSRLTQLCKRPRMSSFDENEDPNSSTPLSALPADHALKSARKLVRFSTNHHLSLASSLNDSIRFSTPVRNHEALKSPSASPSTPFRTPKSVKKGKKIDRILGTPDYLAPELLLRQPHSFGVDWWGLGVCLYEFMTGIPPFTDETPEAVFENILNLKMEWPEEEGEILSTSAIDAIKALLTLDPRQRADFEAMKCMSLFQDLDWDNLTEIQAPFIPQPDDEMDTGYFQARNLAQHWKVSQINL